MNLNKEVYEIWIDNHNPTSNSKYFWIKPCIIFNKYDETLSSESMQNFKESFNFSQNPMGAYKLET